MESFFYEACKLDEIVIIEMLLRRYHEIDYILKMPLAQFVEFYKIAREKEKEERIFAQWTQQMPFMSRDNYISFEDYKDRLTGKNIDTRSTAEISAETDEIERRLLGRG